jgi:hypothetical protein
MGERSTGSVKGLENSMCAPPSQKGGLTYHVYVEAIDSSSR